MPQAVTKAYGESLVNFYDEQVMAHADTVYRFALALTLNLDAALACTRRAYQTVARELERLKRPEARETSLVAVLIGEAFKAYGQVKKEKASEGQSAVTKALKPIAFEGRAALIAVDSAGLTPRDAAKAFGWSEAELRMKLAEARRTLMMSALDM